MVKRPARSTGRGAKPKSGSEFSEYVADLFRQLGWEVQFTPRGRDGGRDFDLIKADGFIYQHFVVEAKDWTRPVTADVIRSVVSVVETSQKITGGVVVADSFAPEALNMEGTYPSVNLITVKRLEEEVARKLGNRSRARTRAGKAILANQPEIAVTSGALIVLIDERLAQLRNARPNSPEATDEKHSSIEHYDRLKQDLIVLADAAAKFKEGAISEREAVKASKSALDGIQNWWNKSHEKICERALDMGLFAIAVSICSMAGSGGKVAVAVSAALVGGKQLGTALKGLKGLWS